jgi:hypothetical protein
MARGSSGRIVLEVERELKHDLYSSLAHENRTLKDWFVSCARAYLREHPERSVVRATEPPPASYGRSRDDG